MASRPTKKKALESARKVIARQGKSRVAKKLGISQGKLDTYLKKGFPAELVKEASALADPKKEFTQISGTRIKSAVKRLGKKRLSDLTGLPQKRIEALAKKPGAPIRASRQRLRKLKQALSSEKLQKAFGTRAANISRAAAIPKTRATRRLQDFAARYGLSETSDFLGIPEKRLSRWIAPSANVPKRYEALINRQVGVTKDRGADRRKVGKPRPIGRQIASALKRAAEWNKKVPRRFHINKTDAQRWGAAGIFTEQFQAIKRAWRAAQKKPPKKKTPERKPRKPGARRPPPPPKPIALPDAIQERIKEFKRRRAEAIASGDNTYNLPQTKFGVFERWKLTFRRGLRYYEAVEEFLQFLDYDKVLRAIVSAAKKMWPRVKGKDAIMTLRGTFSAEGEGNPFYPESWNEPDDDEDAFSFFSRNSPTIYEASQIENAARQLLADAYEIQEEIGMLLYFEHFEVVKSVAI